MTNYNTYDIWWSQRSCSSVQTKHVYAHELMDKSMLPLVDMGCGDGIFLRLLEESFPVDRLSGIEWSAEAIAKKQCAATITRGSILESRLPDGTKTAALIDVLEHLNDPGILLRQLRDQGIVKLILSVPNFSFFVARWEVLRGNVPFQCRPTRGGHCYWFTWSNFQSLLVNSGWVIETTNHLAPKGHWPQMRRLCNAFPSLLSPGFIVRATLANAKKFQP